VLLRPEHPVKVKRVQVVQDVFSRGRQSHLVISDHGSNEDFPAHHPGTGEPPRKRALVVSSPVQPQNGYGAASHVLPQVIISPSTDDHAWFPLPVLAHLYPSPVPDATPHEDVATLKGLTYHVSRIAIHDDSPRVHSVTARICCAPVHGDLQTAVEVCDAVAR